MGERQKIVVDLRRDEDGYPPFEHEGLWAKPTDDGHWEINSIPFFARGISNHDVVTVSRSHGELRYRKVARRGGHSTIRLLFEDLDRIAEVRLALAEHGCSSEVSNLPRLISVDVKIDADYRAARLLLRTLKRAGVLEYEDGNLQHTFGSR